MFLRRTARIAAGEAVCALGPPAVELAEGTRMITLGEGQTPLIELPRLAAQLEASRRCTPSSRA